MLMRTQVCVSTMGAYSFPRRPRRIRRQAADAGTREAGTPRRAGGTIGGGYAGRHREPRRPDGGHGRTIGHRPGRADKRVKTLSREWRARAWSRPGAYPRRGKDIFTPGRSGGAGKADLRVRPPRADA